MNEGSSSLTRWRPDVPLAVHQLLKHGEISDCQLVPWGSNYTFSVTLRFADQQGTGIYKPRRGEVPLWDFPDGTLYRREYAAFVASQALGWSFVPATVIRTGPHGVGSVQLYVDSSPPRSIRELQDPTDVDLARVAAFDFIANNADRKAGHLLRGSDGKLWSIDHGLCFNIPPKVRTVLLHLCGQPLPPSVCEELTSFRTDDRRVADLEAALCPIIEAEEIRTFLRRIDGLLQHGSYPSLDPHRSVPWPPF
jgi:uncharacterized repeat protein (TIGR03843 family)